jgi:ABC-2 type transport system ATP-binding protein
LDYFARFHGFSAAERKERVQKVLQKVGLETAGKIQLRKFSKGMLQRVGLAQAILHDPKLVILDEPMSGLDPVGRREVRDIILELKNAGKTILFSTHILPDAETLCDRVGVIAGGQLRGVGAPGSIVGVKSLGMEILFELTGSGPQFEAIRAKAAKSGANYRMSASEAELYAVLAELQEGGAKIISVTQIKPTLEDFFLELVGKDRARAAAIEVSGQ